MECRNGPRSVEASRAVLAAAARRCHRAVAVIAVAVGGKQALLRVLGGVPRCPQVAASSHIAVNRLWPHWHWTFWPPAGAIYSPDRFDPLYVMPG